MHKAQNKARAHLYVMQWSKAQHIIDNIKFLLPVNLTFIWYVLVSQTRFLTPSKDYVITITKVERMLIQTFRFNQFSSSLNLCFNILSPFVSTNEPSTIVFFSTLYTVIVCLWMRTKVFKEYRTLLFTSETLLVTVTYCISNDVNRKWILYGTKGTQ